jgi:hypothetical protein
MASSAGILILFKVAELAQRCGLRPSDAQAFIDDDDDRVDETLSVVFADRGEPGQNEKLAQFKELLGLPANDESIGELTVPHMSDLEDAVDTALSRAPRARCR